MDVAFFEFIQNNSGGTFSFNSERGISHWVIIEAHSADEANRKAESIGLYFDGRGDCSCCGNRWYEARGKGDAVPSVYGEPAKEIKFGPWSRRRKWMGGPEGFIHYADGRIESFGK